MGITQNIALTILIVTVTTLFIQAFKARARNYYNQKLKDMNSGFKDKEN